MDEILTSRVSVSPRFFQQSFELSASCMSTYIIFVWSQNLYVDGRVEGMHEQRIHLLRRCGGALTTAALRRVQHACILQLSLLVLHDWRQAPALTVHALDIRFLSHGYNSSLRTFLVLLCWKLKTRENGHWKTETVDCAEFTLEDANESKSDEATGS